MRGGERVLEALAELFPSADLFTLVCDRSVLPTPLSRRRIHTSFLQSFPHSTRWYRYYLPLFPAATEQLDLRGYDLVISSDAATMKGIRADADATHICYCHTPMRCLWSGYQTYYQAAGPVGRLGLSAIRNCLCRWDYEAAQRVTQFVANSQTVRKRIQNSYGRKSVVIFPPVDTARFVPGPCGRPRDEYFLLVSQLVPYKRVDLVVEAFNQCGKPLVIIGDGPERTKLQRRARTNIRFEGSQPQLRVIESMQRCKAFVFAGEEDFGIVMAEAQACGTPVIALNKGGAREIVEDGETGTLFEEESTGSLLGALERFRRTRLNPSAIRDSAMRFGRECFLREFRSFVIETLERKGADHAPVNGSEIPSPIETPL